MNILRILIFILLIGSIAFGTPHPKLMTFNVTDTSNDAKEIVITFIVPEKDYIYKDFITCSVHEPAVTLSPWKADKQSVSHYDPLFKDTKQVFNETFSITMTATTQHYRSDPVHLYCSYYRRSEKKINHVLFTLSFPQSQRHSEEATDGAVDISLNDVQKINHSQTISENYLTTLLALVHNTAITLKVNYKKYVLILTILLALFCLLFYFHKEQLQQHKKLYELLELFFSLLITSSIFYALVYVHDTITPLMTMIIGCMCTSTTGFFYIQKSTKLQSGYLRTLCTCIGNVCIYIALFLLFKTMQF